MVGFLLRRLVGLAGVLLFLHLAAFVMVRLIPGDPAVLIAGPTATPDDLVRIRQRLGVDRPWPVQFVRHTGNLLRGDLGTSFVNQQPVFRIVADRIGPTAQLAGTSLFVVLLFSVPLGMFMAHATRGGRHRTVEVVWTAVTAAAGSVPAYLMAVLLVLVFAVWLRWLPVAGREGLQSLVLPVLAISIGPTLSLARIVRVQVLGVLAQDYIRTAHAKRLPTRIIYVRHVMPNVLTTALTVGGVLFGGLIAGTVFVETIFARLGMGSALVNSIVSHDYPVVQAVILLLGVVVVLANAVVDLTVGMLDPRSLLKHG